MHDDNRRRHKREKCQALITYSVYDKINYHEAIMRDKSLEGIGFESDIEIESRRPFSIIMPPLTGNFEASVGHPAYVARLKWCKKSDKRCHYTMGAQLMFQGYVINIDELYSISGRCDLCGEKLSNKVYKTDEPLFLCLNCFKYLGGVLENDSRDSVMRFALGNVI